MVPTCRRCHSATGMRLVDAPTMNLIDMDTLAAAFRSYTDGSAKFTRLMAIALADMDGTTPLRAGKRHKALPKGGLFAD